MGKIEDMQRLREAQHAARSTGARPAAAASEPVLDPDAGTCSVCGKHKPLQRGLVASHQKGLGSMCPGSRKPPS